MSAQIAESVIIISHVVADHRKELQFEVAQPRGRVRIPLTPTAHGVHEQTEFEAQQVQVRKLQPFLNCLLRVPTHDVEGSFLPVGNRCPACAVSERATDLMSAFRHSSPKQPADSMYAGAHTLGLWLILLATEPPETLRVVAAPYMFSSGIEWGRIADADALLRHGPILALGLALAARALRFIGLISRSVFAQWVANTVAVWPMYMAEGLVARIAFHWMLDPARADSTVATMWTIGLTCALTVLLCALLSRYPIWRNTYRRLMAVLWACAAVVVAWIWTRSSDMSARTAHIADGCVMPVVCILPPLLMLWRRPESSSTSGVTIELNPAGQP